MNCEGVVGELVAFPAQRRESMLRTRDLVRIYGMSERWWRYRIKEGLPRHPWGGQYVYYASEIEAWMEGRRHAV